MIERQYQESGVTRESRNPFDTMANSSDQSKELDYDKKKAKRNKHHFKGCSNQPYNPSILARRASLKPSAYAGIEIDKEDHPPTNEKTTKISVIGPKVTLARITRQSCLLLQPINLIISNDPENSH